RRAGDRIDSGSYPLEIDTVLTGVFMRNDRLDLCYVGNSCNWSNPIGSNEFQLRNVLCVNTNCIPTVLVQENILEAIFARRNNDSVKSIAVRSDRLHFLRWIAQVGGGECVDPQHRENQ